MAGDSLNRVLDLVGAMCGSDVGCDSGIIGSMLSMSMEDVFACLRDGKEQDLLYLDCGRLYLTANGKLHLEGLRTPDKQESMLSFKMEALTGIKEETGRNGKKVTVRSKIDRAVLPSSGITDGMRGTTPEDNIEAMQSAVRAKDALCERLGVTQEELSVFAADDRLRFCNGDDSDNGHLGIFDRKNNGWQHICRNCRRDRRKNGR